MSSPSSTQVLDLKPAFPHNFSPTRHSKPLNQCGGLNHSRTEVPIWLEEESGMELDEWQALWDVVAHVYDTHTQRVQKHSRGLVPLSWNAPCRKTLASQWACDWDDLAVQLQQRYAKAGIRVSLVREELSDKKGKPTRPGAGEIVGLRLEATSEPIVLPPEMEETSYTEDQDDDIDEVFPEYLFG